MRCAPRDESGVTTRGQKAASRRRATPPSSDRVLARMRSLFLVRVFYSGDLTRTLRKALDMEDFCRASQSYGHKPHIRRYHNEAGARWRDVANTAMRVAEMHDAAAAKEGNISKRLPRRTR
jgi:hypothetical protein